MRHHRGSKKDSFNEVLGRLLERDAEAPMRPDICAAAVPPPAGRAAPSRNFAGYRDEECNAVLGELAALAGGGNIQIADIVAIRPADGPEQLRKMRRTLAARYHPDRLPERWRETGEMAMKLVNRTIDEALQARLRHGA